MGGVNSTESELDWWELMGADENVSLMFLDKNGVHIWQEGNWRMPGTHKPKGKPRPGKPKPRPGY